MNNKETLSMKILLAEDEKDLSNAITKVLELSKYEVVQAFDGEEALEYLQENSFDGVILDVMMPKKDGFEVVKTMREKKDSTPVMILTARSDTDDKVMGLDCGADDYLAKPFEVKELLARLRAILRRNVDYKEAYSIGNTTLNHDTFELSAVTSCRLTNTEYRLMEYLIRNQNTLLATEKIMAEVWTFDSDCEINVVWAYISNLRKKLNSIGSDYTIKALRGVGYQLVKDDGTEE